MYFVIGCTFLTLPKLSLTFANLLTKMLHPKRWVVSILILHSVRDILRKFSSSESCIRYFRFLPYMFILSHILNWLTSLCRGMKLKVTQTTKTTFFLHFYLISNNCNHFRRWGTWLLPLAIDYWAAFGCKVFEKSDDDCFFTRLESELIKKLGVTTGCERLCGINVDRTVTWQPQLVWVAVHKYRAQ